MQSTREIEKGEIAFEKVSFRYGGGETDVLRNISFHIRPGETVAIAGATGSAKSSLVQLIPRLYDVSAGEIRIDGIPVQDYNLRELHARIGMVLQKNELFTGTIAENLRWGKPDATQEELEVAAVPPKPMSSSARCLPDTTHCWDGVESTFPADRSNASASPGPCCVNPRY